MNEDENVEEYAAGTRLHIELYYGLADRSGKEPLFHMAMPTQSMSIIQFTQNLVHLCQEMEGFSELDLNGDSYYSRQLIWVLPTKLAERLREKWQEANIAEESFKLEKRKVENLKAEVGSKALELKECKDLLRVRNDEIAQLKATIAKLSEPPVAE